VSSNGTPVTTQTPWVSGGKGTNVEYTYFSLRSLWTDDPGSANGTLTFSVSQ
jgi:hypothetical protein